MKLLILTIFVATLHAQTLTVVSGDGQLIPANMTAQSKPIRFRVLDGAGNPLPNATVAFATNWYVWPASATTDADGIASTVLVGATLNQSYSFRQATVTASISGLSATAHGTVFYVSPQSTAYVTAVKSPDSPQAGDSIEAEIGKPSKPLHITVYASQGMQAGQPIPGVSVALTDGRCNEGAVFTDAKGAATCSPVFDTPGTHNYNATVGAYFTFAWLAADVAGTVAMPPIVAPLGIAASAEATVLATGGTPPYSYTVGDVVVTVTDVKGVKVSTSAKVSLKTQ